MLKSAVCMIYVSYYIYDINFDSNVQLYIPTIQKLNI